MNNCYKIYCHTPNEKNGQDLANHIINGDIEPDNFATLYDIRAVAPLYEQSKNMWTSGTSTGSKTKYAFGPLQSFWLNKIESAIKQSTYKVALLNRMGARPGPTIFSDKPESWYSYFISVGQLTGETVEQTISAVSQLSDKQPIIIGAQPNVLLYLNTCDNFVDFVIQNKSNVSLMSTGWDAFYRKKHLQDKGVRINDNMVNWYDGLNFYTCTYNQRHSLPIFAIKEDKIINILNLADGPRAQGDHYILGTDICRCGKRIVKEFVPHVSTAIKADNQFVYDLSLAEKLTAKYQYVQFVQNGNTIDVLYCCHKIAVCDFDVINSYFKAYDFKVQFCRNKFLRFSFFKLPVFYNNIHNLPYARYAREMIL